MVVESLFSMSVLFLIDSGVAVEAYFGFAGSTIQLTYKQHWQGFDGHLCPVPLFLCAFAHVLCVFYALGF